MSEKIDEAMELAGGILSELAGDISFRPRDCILADLLRPILAERDDAFQALEALGVPKTRAITVANGIEVLSTRCHKESTGLEHDKRVLEAERDALRVALDRMQEALDLVIPIISAVRIKTTIPPTESAWIAITEALAASPSPDSAQGTEASKAPDRLCSMEDARQIWECAIEAAQDVPGPAENGETEAIATIAYKVDELLKRRIAEAGE